MENKDNEKALSNDVVNIKYLPALGFKGTTKKNLIPLLIDESSMCYSDSVKEYFIKTACFHEEKIDKLSKNK